MRATVMGLGKFGGGIGAAKFLAEKGAEVTVTDLKSREELSESVKKLNRLDIRFVLGRHEIKDFTEAQLVVVSPAVSRDSEFIRAARRAGIPLRTEIGLFVEKCPAPVCGITGSNGKTTTVSMLKSILEKSGKPHRVGGNIGGSLLSDLGNISPDDLIVLELSSFQLEWLKEIAWSPHIAAVLNILPDHLDRHGTLTEYTNAKAAILEHQKTSDRTVLVRDDPGSRSLSQSTRGHITWVGSNLNIPGITLDEGNIVVRSWRKITPIISASHLNVPGRHSVMNAMAAVACAREMGLSNHAIAEGLGSFKGLPHRLEPLGTYRGVTFYNDSKATTPEAATAGVEAFEAPVIPIFGGYDKGVSFDKMARRLAGRIRWAALIGKTAPALSRALESAGVGFSVYGSLGKAFKACVSRAQEGDIVLLSPGCASYDMFTDFEERGDAFRRLVKRYKRAH